MNRTVLNYIRSIKSDRKSRRKSSAKAKSMKATSGPRKLNMDGLESRDMFSVASLWFSGNTLVVKTDNASTSVNVSQVGSNLRISEVGTTRVWNYQASTVGRVEFQGGNGNDRFVNYVANLPVTAFGFGGNDYLEGYNGADDLMGGDGNDTLVGSSGPDRMWGGNGDDFVRGGDGNDLLMGEAGNDRLIGQAGADQYWAGDGNDVVVSIDGAFNEYVDGGLGTDILWIDRVGSSRDSTVGNLAGDTIQEVASFANGADRTLNGDNIADPTDSGVKLRFSNDWSAASPQGTKPLFGASGPRASDVTQGNVGDCWLLAGLGAVGFDSPNTLRQNVVDFGDGTYGVRLGNSFYRVDNELPVWNSANGATAANLRYSSLGAQNSMWVAIVEKAFAHYRTRANAYASLNGGWSIEVNRAFRSASAGEKSIKSYANATALANNMFNRWNTHQAVTIGFVGALVGKPPLLANHMYAVVRVNRNSAGQVLSVVLRNPHGNNTSQFGVEVTLTPAQLFAQTGSVNWGRV